jgi:glycosyltransferase involved in cell wall biosynthesis
MADETAPDDPPAGQGFRIGINLSGLTLGGGGMRQYVLQLLPWLLRLSAHRFVVFYHLQGWPSLASLLRRLSPEQRGRLELVEVHRQEDVFAHAGRFDVYFSPLNGFGPDLLDRPTLSTIADVQEQFFPHYFTAESLGHRAAIYPHTAHAVTTLLTISEFSRESICKAFGVPPAKVRAVHLAPNDDLVAAPPRWPAELGEPPGRFVFYPANLYPHKNHAALLDALALLRERGIECECVLTGRPAEPGIDLNAEVARRHLAGRVRWLGHVAGPTLRWLYENAVVLCFPSQFEGFGMPLVEAMLCGCPVVANPSSSVPEICGGAALLVPASGEAYADAVAALLADPAMRDELVARGRTRAQHFSARRLAEETLHAIEDAVAGFHPPRPTGAGAGTLTFVVRPRAGGRALVETLTSVAFEAEEHDEVLVTAEPGQLDGAARTLCANLGIVRFVPPGGAGWLMEVNREQVWVLDEGRQVCEGAARAALAALAAEPAAPAVVGEVLWRAGGGALAGAAYLPPRVGEPRQWHDPPACAVVWRTAFLRGHGGTPAADRPAAALGGDPGGLPLYRTLATAPAPATAPPPPGFRGLVGATGKALVRRMPGWVRRPLRGLYHRVARG